MFCLILINYLKIESVSSKNQWMTAVQKKSFFSEVIMNVKCRCSLTTVMVFQPASLCFLCYVANKNFKSNGINIVYTWRERHNYGRGIGLSRSSKALCRFRFSFRFATGDVKSFSVITYLWQKSIWTIKIFIVTVIVACRILKPPECDTNTQQVST